MRKFVTILVLSVLLFNTQPLTMSAHASVSGITKIFQNIAKYFKNITSKGADETKTLFHEGKTFSDDGLKNVMKKDGDEVLESGNSGNKEFLQQGAEQASSIGDAEQASSTGDND